MVNLMFDFGDIIKSFEIIRCIFHKIQSVRYTRNNVDEFESGISNFCRYLLYIRLLIEVRLVFE